MDRFELLQDPNYLLHYRRYKYGYWVVVHPLYNHWYSIFNKVYLLYSRDVPLIYESGDIYDILVDAVPLGIFDH